MIPEDVVLPVADAHMKCALTHKLEKCHTKFPDVIAIVAGCESA